MGYALHLEPLPREKELAEQRRIYLGFGIMPTFVHMMDRLGMISDPPVPSWPNPAHYDLTGNDFTAPDQVVPGREPDLAALRAAVEAVRAATVTEPAGIPRHKLSSNQGWLVLPAEVTAALAAYQAQPADLRERAARVEDWTEWIDFLHRAADGDGLRVE